VHFLLFLSIAFSSVFNHPDDNAALSQLIKNLDTTNNGAVIASPQKKDPNYYYHWVRDAALVTNTLVQLYKNTDNVSLQEKLSLWLTKSIEFTKKIQSTPNKSKGLGEPKFGWDASAFNEDWGRPQNDGPALRAISMMDWLTDKSLGSAVQTTAGMAIRKDLNYVAKYFNEPSFDIWEEILGDHFFTKMVQRRALAMGGEPYKDALQKLDESILTHWNSEKKLLLPTKNQKGGIEKNTDLDIAIILGALLGNGSNIKPLIDIDDERLLATTEKLIQYFESEYKINKNYDTSKYAPAIGRYPGDMWNGFERGKQASPWFIATASLAELLFRIANKIEVTQTIGMSDLSKPFYARVLGAEIENISADRAVVLFRQYGEKFLNRVLLHAGPDGNLSEQFDRNTGYLTGPENLTWSHVAFLSALIAHPTYKAFAYRP
jgi:glucoamylase